MKRIVMILVVMTFGMSTMWAQNCDLTGDGVVNSADVVYIYNYIINGGTGDVTNEEFTVNGVTCKMIAVEGGTFQMGATSEQGSDAYDNEKPVHCVTLSSYKIGETEVTQALWKAVMGNNPSRLKGEDLPVERVSWDDCQEFIKKLNTLTGKQFRLPTEAEWEYACRGGNKSKGYKYSGSNNIDDVAWYDDNSDSKTHTVATKQPNELCIYDMSGNAWEWCQNWFETYDCSTQINPTGPETGEYRIYRGGGINNNDYYCRSTCRNYGSPLVCKDIVGLRLALPLPICDLNGDGFVNSADVACFYNVVVAKKDDFAPTREFTVNGVTFNMVDVEGGTFRMGATKEMDSEAFADESPVRNVTLSSYSIGQTEVTQALWKAVMGTNPSWFKNDDYPVDNLSWYDCQEFISKLNELTGKMFRLPTEAEWEYACRGGNKSKGYKYSGSKAISDVTWYGANSKEKIHKVATKLPNELGIYDMTGNATEWCQNWYGPYDGDNVINPTGPKTGSKRVKRGGNFGNSPEYCRSTYRNYALPEKKLMGNGFRLVLP